MAETRSSSMPKRCSVAPAASRAANPYRAQLRARGASGRQNSVLQKPRKPVPIEDMLEHVNATKETREQVGHTVPRKRDNQHGDADHITKQKLRSNLATRSTDKRKGLSAHTIDPDFLKNLHRPVANVQPDFGLFDAVHTYGESAAAAQIATDELRRSVLQNRCQGLDEDGEPRQPHVPSWKDIGELEKQIENMDELTFGGLGEEIMTVVIDQEDGRQVTTDVRFEDTLAEFFTQCARRFDKIKTFEQEVSQISREIKILAEDLTHDTEEIKKLNEEHDAEMKTMRMQLELIEKEAQDEKAKLKRDEHDRKEALSKRIADMLDDLA